MVVLFTQCVHVARSSDMSFNLGPSAFFASLKILTALSKLKKKSAGTEVAAQAIIEMWFMKLQSPVVLTAIMICDQLLCANLEEAGRIFFNKKSKRLYIKYNYYNLYLQFFYNTIYKLILCTIQD